MARVAGVTPMSVAVERLLERLERVRQTGGGAWEACCPAHDDRRPSLSIRDGGDRALLICHADCDIEGVVAPACSSRHLPAAIGEVVATTPASSRAWTSFSPSTTYTALPARTASSTRARRAEVVVVAERDEPGREHA